MTCPLWVPALVIMCCDSNRLGDTRLLLERAVRPMHVVVSGILAQHSAEVSSTRFRAGPHGKRMRILRKARERPR